MIKLLRLPFAISLCLAAWTQLQAAAPKQAPSFIITADHPDAIYKSGETVRFTVQLTADSKLATDAELNWKISKDGVPPIRTGRVQLTNGTATITGQLAEPGHLLCSMTGTVAGKPENALAGAAFDPLLIKPSLPVPDDFDAFWDAQKKKLAAVPMNPRLTPVANSAAPNLACFDVQLDCVGSAPVSGYLAKPAGAKPKSLPILLHMHGAGVSSAMLNVAAHWAQHDLLAMDINAHGLPNGRPQQFYTDLSLGALKDYRRFGSDSRETCYFLGMFLRAARALDFLTTQPEWDGKTIIVDGISQGGFQAFAVAYLDNRVSFLSAGEPAGCDHSGMVAGRACGWPKLVSTDAAGQPDAKELQTARYFDNVNFAAHTKAKRVFLTVGFIDTTCPATTVYAAYNNLPIPKQIFNDIPAGHILSPPSIAASEKAVFDYLKSVK
jgi:cephalosporin-C deacetylase-like acetyl esterase